MSKIVTRIAVVSIAVTGLGMVLVGSMFSSNQPFITNAQALTTNDVVWSETIPSDSKTLALNLQSILPQKEELFTGNRRGAHYIHESFADYIELGDMAVFAMKNPVTLNRDKVYLLSKANQSCVELKLEKNADYRLLPGKNVVFVYGYEHLYRIEAGSKKITALQNFEGDLVATDGDDIYFCMSEQESPVYKVNAGETKGKIIGKVNADVIKAEAGQLIGFGPVGVSVLKGGKTTTIKDYHLNTYTASNDSLYKFEGNTIKQFDASLKNTTALYTHTNAINTLVSYKDTLIWLDEKNDLYQYNLKEKSMTKVDSKKVKTLTTEGGVPVIETLIQDTTIIEQVVSDDKILCYTSDGMLELRDMKNQAPQWSYKVSGQVTEQYADDIRLRTQIAVAENYIYFKDFKNRLWVFNMQGTLLEKGIGDESSVYVTVQSELFYSGSEGAWVKHLVTNTNQPLYKVSKSHTWRYEKNNYLVSSEMTKGTYGDAFKVIVKNKKTGKTIYQNVSADDPRLVTPNILIMKKDEEQAVFFSLLSGKATPVAWHSFNERPQSCVQYTDMTSKVYFVSENFELCLYDAKTGQVKRVKDKYTFPYARTGLGQQYQVIEVKGTDQWQLKDYSNNTTVNLPNLQLLYMTKAQRYVNMEALNYEWQGKKVYLREQGLLTAVYDLNTKNMLII